MPGPTVRAVSSAVVASGTSAVVTKPTGTADGDIVVVRLQIDSDAAITSPSGWINPSADGTFAIRATSEVTVGAGLTVKAGSWLQLWEADS